MLNRTILIGRLTKDPELRSTQSGTSVCTFTLAVDRGFTTNDGKKETDFIPVVTWKGLADNCAKNLAKGKMVAVDGRLQIRTYEASDGSKRTIAEVIAETVRFLSPKSESNGMPTFPNEEMAPMDEIPF